MLVEVYQNVVAELKLLLDQWFRMLQRVEFDGSLHIELRVAVVIKLTAVQNNKNFLLLTNQQIPWPLQARSS
jgi:hypothetical protein